MRKPLRVAAIALTLLAAPASASVVVPLDLPELVGRSELIVHAVPTRQESVWEGGRIVTRTTLRVIGALKGSAGKEVEVRHFGGVVHGIGQKLYGEPTFSLGEEVVLFLRSQGGELRTVGMAQGKFRVVADPRTGRREAIQELGGLALARRRGAGDWTIASARPKRLRLRDFFSRIAEEVARRASARP